MSVPIKLTKNCHVFCYSSDLLKASEQLAEYLECKVSTVYNDKFDPESTTAKVAWLVGHGSKEDTIVGTAFTRKGIPMADISKWLKDHEYEYLVDTCCEPNLRKDAQTFADKYYCTNDDQKVKVITGYNNFGKWWNDNNMHQNTATLAQLS